MPKQLYLETPAERLYLYTFASAEEIGRLNFDKQFKEHTGFRSLYTRRETLMRRADEEDANVVLAVTEDKTIIGFGVLAHAGEDQRWAALYPKTIMEVKAVEVTRDWRQKGVGKAIVKAMLSDPGVEDKILYFVGFTWVWDLTGAKIEFV